MRNWTRWGWMVGFWFVASAYALPSEPFFQNSFLNLQEDAQSAGKEGKIVAIFYEQEGCPYCDDWHRDTLSDPRVRSYLQAHFYAIAFDIFGAREVVDFQGKTTREKAFARQEKVHLTPLVIFYSSRGEELFRLAGVWRPPHFLATLEFVAGGLYRTGNLQDYLRQKLLEKGQPP
ncbi:MAG: thioredoxin fold domain-containing protein [Magnetococcales bacterium]|nr:thioredoxin fold domain-containing protein [Magnetococcales bacterium]